MADRTVEFALVGGGLAAGNCARWLREEGADGSIVLIGREPDLPYNRPDCSKGYLRGEKQREAVLCSSCALVMMESVVLSRGFGEQAGRVFEARLRDHGIQIHADDTLARFEGADGRVQKVVTEGGLELEADAVVIGAGVMPDVA